MTGSIPKLAVFVSMRSQDELATTSVSIATTNTVLAMIIGPFAIMIASVATIVVTVGGWHYFDSRLPSPTCHGLPALRMPVCLRAPLVRTPDPPHPARLPTQPCSCARTSRNRNLSARISNIFFFSPSNHLGPTPPAFSADLCARTTPHGGRCGGPHKCV
jgi:hypothetical protein